MRFGPDTSKSSSWENRGAEHMGMLHKTFNFTIYLKMFVRVY